MMKNIKVNSEVKVSFLCSFTRLPSCVLIINKKHQWTTDIYILRKLFRVQYMLRYYTYWFTKSLALACALPNCINNITVNTKHTTMGKISNKIGSKYSSHVKVNKLVNLQQNISFILYNCKYIIALYNKYSCK